MEKRPFWTRFAERERPAFDLFFGVVLPLVCFVLDPGIFVERDLFGPAMFPGLRIPVYVLAGTEMLLLAAWLTGRVRTPRACAFSAGALAAGAVFAFGVGVVLAPLAVVGLVAVIGLLGLVPFFTAVVFLSNAIRAFRRSGVTWRSGARGAVLAGAMAVAVLPAGTWVAGRGAYRVAVHQLRGGGDDGVANAVAVLRRVRWLVDSDRLVHLHNRTYEPAFRARIARAYEQLTGRPLSKRSVELFD